MLCLILIQGNSEEFLFHDLQGTDYAILKMTKSLWVADICQTLCLSLLLIYTYNIFAK